MNYCEKHGNHYEGRCGWCNEEDRQRKGIRSAPDFHGDDPAKQGECTNYDAEQFEPLGMRFCQYADAIARREKLVADVVEKAKKLRPRIAHLRDVLETMERPECDDASVELGALADAVDALMKHDGEG